jgi:acyl-CoA reductase-like NAD-dependent aldehyde dehydrogenase
VRAVATLDCTPLDEVERAEAMTLTSTSPETVPGSARAHERPVLDPATGAVIAMVPDSTLAEVDEAVRTARAAFDGGPWPTMTRSARARLLLRAADAIEDAAERLFRLETRNNGRPITETRAQLSRVPEWFRYNAGLLAAQRDAVLPGDGPYLTYQRRTPLGVCGIITPFNHPLLILARSLSAALATGNTVVVKPSETTPLSTLALVEILREAGVPDGVVNVVTGGRDVGEALTHHPDIAKITLTGGTESPPSWAARPRSSSSTTSTRTPRPRAPPSPRSSPPGSRASPARASSCSAGSTTRSSRPSRRAPRPSGSATPRTRRRSWAPWSTPSPGTGCCG